MRPLRLGPRFYIQLRADAPNEFSPVGFRGKHPAQEKQIARLHRFHIGAKRLGRRRELDAKFFQPLLGTGWPRAFAGYHLLFYICFHFEAIAKWLLGQYFDLCYPGASAAGRKRSATSSTRCAAPT